MGITSSFSWLGQRVTDAVLGDMDKRLHLAGQRWLAAVEPITPVRTGELRAGLFYRVENRTLIVGGTALHTLFVDRGTRFMAGQWFIERALNEIGSVFGASLEMEFTVPHIVSPVLSHGGRMIAPSGIQPRPLTQAQHRRVAANQAMGRNLHRGNVKRAKVRVRRFGS
jgi:hypothetical protein